MSTTTNSPTATELGLQERMGRVRDLAQDAGTAGFARIDAEKLLGLSDTQAQYLLRKMGDMGQIEMRGTTFARRYYAVDHAPAEDAPPPLTAPRVKPAIAVKAGKPEDGAAPYEPEPIPLRAVPENDDLDDLREMYVDFLCRTHPERIVVLLIDGKLPAEDRWLELVENTLFTTRKAA